MKLAFESDISMYYANADIYFGFYFNVPGSASIMVEIDQQMVNMINAFSQPLRDVRRIIIEELEARYETGV